MTAVKSRKSLGIPLSATPLTLAEVWGLRFEVEVVLILELRFGVWGSVGVEVVLILELRFGVLGLRLKWS
jgi:hypothetical protein